MNVAEIAVQGRLSNDAERWLTTAITAIKADARAIRALFPAVGRKCGRGPLQSDELPGWTVDEAARVTLLDALPADALTAEIGELYRFGDAAEKRAVLRGLELLPIGDNGLPIIRDALRTNDARLIAAAMGPHGAEKLDQHAYRHGVLKCVFMGIPLADISGLDRRVDDELVAMLRSFAAERAAAGRSIPTDVIRFLPELPEP